MASVSQVNTLGILSLVCDIMFDLMKASNWLLKRLQNADCFPTMHCTHLEGASKQTMPQGKQLETVGCGHRPRRLRNQFRPKCNHIFSDAITSTGLFFLNSTWSMKCVINNTLTSYMRSVLFSHNITQHICS